MMGSRTLPLLIKEGGEHSILPFFSIPRRLPIVSVLVN